MQLLVLQRFVCVLSWGCQSKCDFLPLLLHRFYQNLHWKLGRLTPSFGSTLALWLKKYFFRDKTFKLKLKFVKPHKISTHSGYSDNCYFHFFSISCLIELKFYEVSPLSLEKQKSFIPIKKNLGRCQYQNKKKIPEGFVEFIWT